MDKTALISTISKLGDVDGGRHKEPPRVGGCARPSTFSWSHEGTSPEGGREGISQEGGRGGYQVRWWRCLPMTRTSTPRYTISDRPTSLQINLTAKPLTSKSHGSTRRPCGRNTLIVGRIRRSGSSTDCWMRGRPSWCSSQWINTLSQCGFMIRRRMSTVGPRKPRREL